MIINNDEKNSSVNKLNSILTELYIKLLSDHYFSDNDLYDDSDYKNNINFKLYDYCQDHRWVSRKDLDKLPWRFPYC